MTKQANTEYPIHQLLSSRWSPYGFADKPVSGDDLCSLFEAARWAASSYNEQPWSFIVATREEPEDYARLLACLVEGNQAWARFAPILVLTVAKRRHARNDKPNKAAEHDVGLAVANLTVEATARGLAVHQMIGIDPEKARASCGVPIGWDVLTGLAIGHAEPAASRLPEPVQQRDRAERSRKPLADLVFGGTWGNTCPFLPRR